MAVTAVCSKLTIDPKAGHVTVYWSDGTVQQYASLSAIKQSLAELEQQVARLLVLYKFLTDSPDGSDRTKVESLRVTLDPRLSTMVIADKEVLR